MMTTRPKIELHSAAIGALLRSGEVAGVIEGIANTIAARAGEGFQAEVTIGRRRALGSVVPVTAEARRAEQTDRVLTRAVESVRR